MTVDFNAHVHIAHWFRAVFQGFSCAFALQRLEEDIYLESCCRSSVWTDKLVKTERCFNAAKKEMLDGVWHTAFLWRSWTLILTETHWRSQLRTRRSPASPQSSGRRQGRPQRRRVCRWVCWRCSPALRSQHRRNQEQIQCSLGTRIQRGKKNTLTWPNWILGSLQRSNRKPQNHKRHTSDLPSASLLKLC